MEQLDGVISYDCPPFVKIRCNDGIVFQPVVLTWSSWTVLSPTIVRHLSRPTFTGRFICTYLYKSAFPYPLEVLWEGAVAGDGFLLFFHIIPLAKWFNIGLYRSKQKILFAIFRRMHLSKKQPLRYCPFKCNYCRTFSSHTEFFFYLFATAYTFFKEPF